MDPLNLKNFLIHLQSQFTEINRNWMVVNETHVGNILSEVSQEENAFLIGVLPTYDTDGESSDNYRTVAYGQFLIVEKTDYSNLDQEQFLDVFQRTFKITEQIRDLIIRYSAEKQCAFPFLMEIDINSLKMDPVYKLYQCNGWSLEFAL